MNLSIKNHELFLKDPRNQKLANEGVAQVKGAKAALFIAEELEMFVCEGQYAKGLEIVVQTFCNNSTKEMQPAVWISGFYGSGKSHLVKVLRYLWTNEPLPSGKTPRDVAMLPDSVKDLLRELDTVSKRSGGKFAAAGILEASSADQLPKAVLSVVYEALGLPPDVSTANFLLWMRQKKLEQKVRSDLEAAGIDWTQDLEAFRLSSDIAESIARHDPTLGKTAEEVLQKINDQFPKQEEIDIDGMTKLIDRAVKEKFNGKFPCSLLVLDEAQQYIGDDADRSFKLQLCVEALSSSFDGKLIVVATGQSALTTTPLLQRLQDRFQRTLHLQDNDIDTVIRKVVLQKKANEKDGLGKLLNASTGEITRQLKDTDLKTKPDDEDRYVDDYPVLPVRRRFWEKVLRNVDTGLTGQLRTQLRITFEAVRSVAHEDVGHVIPGDMLFDQLADTLVEKGALDRDRHNIIQRKRTSKNDDEKLSGRLLALIYMIGKVSLSAPNLGLRATPAVLADLLVEDLKLDGDRLRQQIPPLLDAMEKDGTLLRVGDEFRLQTPESSAWEQHYKQRLAGLLADEGEIGYLRGELFRREITALLQDVTLIQGKSKVRRKLDTAFGDTPPAGEQAVPVWIRTEWDAATKTILADAHAPGTQSPRVTVVIPKVSASELKTQLAIAKASEMTLQERGTPNTPAALEAKNALETRKVLAEQEVRTLLLQTILKDAKAILPGSEDFPGITLTDRVREACEAALSRLYPSFSLADSDKWEEVFKRAKSGDGAPLQIVNHSGNPDQHPVCSAILSEIGPGKKGNELIGKFTKSPYGWSNNAVNAGLMVLIAAGLLKASRNGVPVARQAIDQTMIGVIDYRVDHPPISAMERVNLRGLFTRVGVKTVSNEEVEPKAPEFLRKLRDLAASVGGDPPLPATPDVLHLKKLESMLGNEQLSEMLRDALRLDAEIKLWTSQSELAQKRLSRWKSLEQLLSHARSAELPQAVPGGNVDSQLSAIRDHRQLLDKTDPVPPLCTLLADALRSRLLELSKRAKDEFLASDRQLAADPNWVKLGEKDAKALATIASRHQLSAPPDVSVATEPDLLAELAKRSITSWQELTAALPTRFDAARQEAAKSLVPKAQTLKLPPATISSETELAAWLKSSESAIRAKLSEGPVIV